MFTLGLAGCMEVMGKDVPSGGNGTGEGLDKEAESLGESMG